jgi:hypothetical protein
MREVWQNFREIIKMNTKDTVHGARLYCIEQYCILMLNSTVIEHAIEM